MKKLKLLILDGGGTVWDSMEVLYQSYLWAFEKIGIKKEEFPLSLKEANLLSALKDFNGEDEKARGFLAIYLLNKTAKDFIEANDPNQKLLEIVEEAKKKSPEFEKMNRKLGNFLDEYLYQVFDDSKYPLCKNVRKSLEIFKNDLKLNMALVTNRKRISTLQILKSHNLLPYFDLILAKEDQPKPKPDPEGILKAIKFFSLKPKECLFIGDSAVDIISAKLAGIKCVGVLTGMANRKLMKKAGANLIVPSFLDLVKRLK